MSEVFHVPHTKVELSEALTLRELHEFTSRLLESGHYPEAKVVVEAGGHVPVASVESRGYVGPGVYHYPVIELTL